MTLDDKALNQYFPAYFMSNSSEQPSTLTTVAKSQLEPEHVPDIKPFRKSPAQIEALRQLRRKYKYPTHDPAPNLFRTQCSAHLEPDM